MTIRYSILNEGRLASPKWAAGSQSVNQFRPRAPSRSVCPFPTYPCRYSSCTRKGTGQEKAPLLEVSCCLCRAPPEVAPNHPLSSAPPSVCSSRFRLSGWSVDRSTPLELLLLLEEHAERDDSPVDQQPPDDAHGHGADLDQVRVREDDGQSCGGGRTQVSRCFSCSWRWTRSAWRRRHPAGRRRRAWEKKNVPMPMSTRKPVQKRPRSSTALPELSTKSSGLAQREQIQLGSGASTYVATTSSG
ncbi:hypothetical protein GGR56DRAFT_118147 [Xylariaceae sp. FL0804]|nr:hypothetical protein GGR56DRAFT_118147 [Xylariaceae sp. FL0804]